MYGINGGVIKFMVKCGWFCLFFFGLVICLFEVIGYWEGILGEIGVGFYCVIRFDVVQDFVFDGVDVIEVFEVVYFCGEVRFL